MPKYVVDVDDESVGLNEKLRLNFVEPEVNQLLFNKVNKILNNKLLPTILHVIWRHRIQHGLAIRSNV